jgi:hypothetical protein
VVPWGATLEEVREALRRLAAAPAAGPPPAEVRRPEDPLARPGQRRH